MDLKVRKDDQGNVNIYAAYRKNDKLGIDIFTYSGNNFTNKNYEITISDLASNITLGSGKSVYFWQKSGNNLIFYSKDFNKLQTPPEEKFSLSLKEYYKIVAFTGDLLNNDKDISISFFASEADNFAVVTAGKTSSVIKANNQIPSLNVINKEQLFFGEMKFNGLKKLFVYHNNIIDRFDFLKEGRELITTGIADAENLNRYFIKNMNIKNYHIVFTQKNESPISVNNISQ